MLARWWRFGGGDGIPILMYHRLGRPPAGSRVAGHFAAPCLFAGQMRTLRKLGYTTVTLDQVATYATTGELPAERPVAITFDDGYACLHRLALPVLAKLGFTATVFLVAGHLGGDNPWDQAVGDVADTMLSVEQIRDMRAAGLRFGSHGLHHAHLDRLPEPELQAELSQSRLVLEEVLGEPVHHLAYPYGGYNEKVRAAAAGAGYTTACITGFGVVRRGTDPLQLPRINVRRYNLTARVLHKMSRAYHGESRS